MSSEEIAARYRQVLAWRAEGLTYRCIGQRLGVSASRANDLHRAAQRWQQRRWPRPALPTPDTALAPDTSLDVLPIAARAKQALHRQGLHTVGDVTVASDATLCSIRYIGPRTVAAIRAALALATPSDPSSRLG